MDDGELRSFEAGASEADAFIDVAFAARADDARWIASSRAGLRRQLDASNPLWKSVSRRFFALGRRARCAALLNPRLKADDGSPWGQVGYFEAVDEDSGRRVLDAACAWLRERGCTQAIGPMNGSTWHSYRFVVDWKDVPPLLLEPNNPLRYAAIWEAHGWSRHSTPYFSADQDNAKVAPALLERRRSLEALGYRMEPVDLSDLQKVLRTMFELSLRIFPGNAFYSDISWEEFAPLYDGVERLLEPSLVHWMRGPSGELVGFALGVPDRAEAVRRMRGDAGLLAKLRFATAPRPTRAMIKTIGVVPEHRGKGLLNLIYQTQAEGALAAGLPTSVLTLMAGDNRSFTGQHHGRVIREYALFTRRL